MSFPRYPVYKESDQEWLGDVPNDWDIKPVAAIASCNDEVLDESTPSDYQIEYIEISDVDADHGVVAKAQLEFAAAPSRARRRVKNGDVIVSTVRTYLKAITPIRDASLNTIVSTGFAVMRPRNISAAFLAHVFRAEFLISEIISRSVGVSYPAINASEIRKLKIPVPPVAEQSIIADFLARETAKIDALVAEQEQLVGLLQEKRHAVISEAVTKGLNQNVETKDSGVVWLGEVPEHWGIRKLRQLARLESGHTPSRQRPDYWIEDECVIPWFTLADVGYLRVERNTRIASTSQKISQVGLENSAARLLPSNTVILSRTASVGFSGIINFPLAVSQDFAAWICKPELDPTYLLFCLRAMKPEFKRLMMGSTHQTIYMPDIEAFRVPFPPLAEQVAIAEFVQTTTDEIDTLSTEAERGIELLRERRSALISAAVTGKIDVRGLAPAIQEAA